ncbi:hypothetical protein B0J18DRAFT_300731 [Chaetomium sp. MPI-SDFR-AT-0129]|nr:hypothetical protein B0J18DRAFT_300731 [Chaetomium sp. MPI-SDFR-AT-0129]
MKEMDMEVSGPRMKVEGCDLGRVKGKGKRNGDWGRLHLVHPVTAKVFGERGKEHLRANGEGQRKHRNWLSGLEVGPFPASGMFFLEESLFPAFPRRLLRNITRPGKFLGLGYLKIPDTHLTGESIQTTIARKRTYALPETTPRHRTWEHKKAPKDDGQAVTTCTSAVMVAQLNAASDSDQPGSKATSRPLLGPAMHHTNLETARPCEDLSELLGYPVWAKTTALPGHRAAAGFGYLASLLLMHLHLAGYLNVAPFNPLGANN